MKRIGFLYEKIYDKENIKKAILSASKGKTNRKIVKNIFNNLDDTIDNIHKMLKEKTYYPSPYIKSVIIDGSSKKERVIHKPSFYPDQIVHWSLINIIKPLMERGMYQYTCASVPNRGTLYAQKQVKKWIKNTPNLYVLKVDIKKYYPSMHKNLLKQKFRTIIKDSSVLDLLDIIIDSHDKGIPIGNYTSQWFANFYLQEVDHYIKETLKIKHYIRYMDDMIVLDTNKKKLRKSKLLLEQKLKEHSLDIKSNWQMFNIKKRNLDFVGYVFTKNKVLVRKRITKRMRKIYFKFNKNKSKHYATSLMSYYGWLKHSNSYVIYKKYYKNIKLMKKIISGG